MNINIKDAINKLEDVTPCPQKGLPDDVFYFISRTTPLINVDLLIKDEIGRTLLAWRDDPYAGTGWHIPGGIIRFKESIETRIEQVALNEIGELVEYEKQPRIITQMINSDRDIRGHFISLLYNCRLESSFDTSKQKKRSDEPGFLKWHKKCPTNLISFHRVYASLI